MNISILIPTLDRPHFLLRALEYYEKIYFKGQIIIGDSSAPEHTAKIKAFIDGSGLNIKYMYFPVKDFKHDGECMKVMIEEVTCDYAVYQGDDDFLVPAGLQACIEFLEDNPDYSAAYGIRANLYFDGDKPSSAYLQVAPEFDKDSPAERWGQYMSTGLSTQNYVHHIDTWKAMYEHVDCVPSRYLGPELLPCGMTAILGKTKHVKCLHYVFHKDAPDRQVDWGKFTFMDLVNAPEWSPSVDVLKSALVPFLGDKVFQQGFWFHVANVLLSHFELKYKGTNKPESQLHSVLLNPNFQFYEDFMQVYRCLV